MLREVLEIPRPEEEGGEKIDASIHTNVQLTRIDRSYSVRYVNSDITHNASGSCI